MYQVFCMLKNLLFKNLQDLLVNVFMLFFFKELKRILGDALQRKSGQCLILIIIATCLYESNKGKGGCERLPEKKTERHSGPFCQPLRRIFLGEYTKYLFRPTYQNICFKSVYEKMISTEDNIVHCTHRAALWKATLFDNNMLR